jgi:hypothetical protein
MARGDQIFVMRPFLGLDALYEHHGIDCGDGTVIHYRKLGEESKISRTSYAAFAAGLPIYIKWQPVSFIPDVVIQRAESRLGEEQYNLLSNNCEHFANWCKTGRNESNQLARFGLDTTTLSTGAARELIDEASHAGHPVQAALLVQQALDNIAIARSRLQAQHDHIQSEMKTWQRVAQLALKQGREDLARAALGKKVSYKREANDLKAQLDQLNEMQADLIQKRSTLEQQAQLAIASFNP